MIRTANPSLYRLTAVLPWPAELGQYPRRDLSPAELDAAIDAHVAARIAVLGGLPPGVQEVGAPIPGRNRRGSPVVTVHLYGTDLWLASAEVRAFGRRLAGRA